jgi:hypothetical protein
MARISLVADFCCLFTFSFCLILQVLYSSKEEGYEWYQLICGFLVFVYIFLFNLKGTV